MDVMVRCPTRGSLTVGTSAFLRMIQKKRPGWDVREYVCKFAIDVGRSECVAEAKRQEADFLLMVDDDVRSDERALTLPEHNVPIVAGMVPTWKLGHFHWAAYDLDNQGVLSSIPHTIHRGLQQVYAVGSALLCIRKDVLSLSPADIGPLFSFDKNGDGTMKPLGGEDINFCRKMHTLNIPVYCDTSVLGEHFGAVDMATTMYAADRGESIEGSNPVSRMSFGLVVDTGKLPVSLPRSTSYRRLWDTKKEGPAISGKDKKTISVGNLHFL